MATKINDVTFETNTVVSGFEVHGLVFADRQWDSADDELHVNHDRHVHPGKKFDPSPFVKKD